MSEQLFDTNIEAWNCWADPGQPICLADNSDSGISIALYVKDGDLAGVTLYDTYGLVCAIGTFDADVLIEHVNNESDRV